eukprot:jgi/Hompol1/5051/HPOL_001875-RA
MDVGEDDELRQAVSGKLLKSCGNDRKGRPSYAFYCCALPSPSIVNYDKLLSLLLERLEALSAQEYSVVLFAGGALYYPTWSWTLSAYTRLSRNIRKNLKELYVVHPAMWPKFLLQTMGMIVSPKFARKLIWIDSLTTLQTYVPLENIELPPEIQEYNEKYTMPGYITLSRRQSIKVANTKVFEVRLEDLMGNDGSKGIPRILLDTIDYITKHGLDADGIFRKSASSTSLQEAKRAYNQGKVPDFETLGGVHIAAGLLKMWFREMSEPIFPASLYPLVRDVEKVPSKIDFIRSKFLPCLPIPVQLVLGRLFALLNAVHLNSDSNRMPSSNLTIVWSPNFVRSDNLVLDIGMCAIGVPGAGIGTVVKSCIEDFEDIFGDNVSLLRRSSSARTTGSSLNEI